jgi:hypothetical protein
MADSMLLYAAGLAALAALATGAPPPSRTRVQFDNGWRFARGLANPPSAPCAPFPHTLSAVRCTSLSFSSSGSDKSSCEGDACSAGANVWQLDTGGGCWIGSNCDENVSAIGFTGGARPRCMCTHAKQLTCVSFACKHASTPSTGTARALTTLHHDIVLHTHARSDSVPPGPPCDPPGKYACSPSFDDKAWRYNLTVPHDFVLEGNISKDNDANYGGLAVGTAW